MKMFRKINGFLHFQEKINGFPRFSTTKFQLFITSVLKICFCLIKINGFLHFQEKINGFPRFSTTKFQLFITSVLKICFLFDSIFDLSFFYFFSIGIFVLGWVFFLQTNFDFLTSHFWRNFFLSFKKYCCPELKFEKCFYL